jgi:hypothetical protein
MRFRRAADRLRVAETAPGGSPLRPVVGEHCFVAGCDVAGDVQCSYVDRRQRRCTTHWCSQHVDVVDGRSFCRRHAGVVRAIGNEPDALLALPDLENRAPSLVNWVGCHVDANIRQLLARYTARGGRVAGSSTRPVGPPNRRTWARYWKVLSDTGIDVSLSIEVGEADDTIVAACIDEEKVMSAEPPWITARRQGLDLTAEQDASARSYFYGDLLQALEEALSARFARPSLRIPA